MSELSIHPSNPFSENDAYEDAENDSVHVQVHSASLSGAEGEAVASPGAPQRMVEAKSDDGEEPDEDEAELDTSEADPTPFDPQAANERAHMKWNTQFQELVWTHRILFGIHLFLFLLACGLTAGVIRPLRLDLVLFERHVFASPPVTKEWLIFNGFPLLAFSLAAVLVQFAENMACGWVFVGPFRHMFQTVGRNVVRPIVATCVFLMLWLQAAICNGIVDPLHLFFLALAFVLFCRLSAVPDSPDSWMPWNLLAARLGWFVYAVLLLIGTILTFHDRSGTPVAFACFATLLCVGGLFYMANWFREGPHERPTAPRTPERPPERPAAPRTPPHTTDNGRSVRPPPVNFRWERDMLWRLSIIQNVCMWILVFGIN